MDIGYIDRYIVFTAIFTLFADECIFLRPDRWITRIIDRSLKLWRGVCISEVFIVH